MTDKARKLVASIVVPTDFSAASRTAFVHGLALSMILKARLAIVHVGKDPDSRRPWHRYPGVRETLVAWGLLPAGLEPEAVFERTGVAISKVVTEGDDPAAALIGFVNHHAANLLVVGTAARSGAARLLRPSAAAAVARETRVMTLFLPAGADGFVRARDGYLDIGRIVVPVDANPSPGPALDLAGRVAALLSDDPVAIDVVHAGNAPPPGLSLPGDDQSTRWSFRLLDGDPAPAVRAAAAGADLLIMTTAGRYDLRDMLLGSTAERVLEGAPCPLLTVAA